MRKPGTYLIPLILFSAVSAWAASPAEKCESSKLKAQSKHTGCRLKADAIAVVKGTAADYAKCVTKITRSYEKAEARAGVGGCPSEGDLATVLAILDGATTCTSTGTGGGGFVGNGCPRAAGGGLPATGQTTAYGAGSDGAIQAGCAQSYTDNGDGTITDNCTGLMWEKKDDSGGLHDKNWTFTWSGALSFMDGAIQDYIDALNDVSGGGANCFAGYCDWYVPNRNELATLVDYEEFSPSINTAFRQCPAGCSNVNLPTCSCTSSSSNYWSASSNYWSSTTSARDPTSAWYVSFEVGYTGAASKDEAFNVRAVRAGP